MTIEDVAKALVENQVEVTLPDEMAALRDLASDSTGRAEKRQPHVEDGGAMIEVTEDGVAREFTRLYGGRLLFDHDVAQWYKYNETAGCWKKDGQKLGLHYCRLLARKATVREKPAARIMARKAGFAAGVEKFVRADPVHAVQQSVWDPDPWLLCVPGGVVDLRTGKSHPPAPEYRMTMQTAVAPAESENCPLWFRFLEDATGADDGLTRFLQMFLGICLTGITREHILVFIWGGGGNGKSVFLNTSSGILNEYATTASIETFTASTNARHPTELAVLKGKRLVTSSETEEGHAMAEARVKQMTGGDTISARLMRQDSFTFRPQFKLLITGNHRPTLKNVDDAARRRFNIVPFTRKPHYPDFDLEEKLRAEWPAILRWMINGVIDWQENGLVRPSSIVEATNAYFSGQDHFGQWLEEACTIRPGDLSSWVPSRVLFESWSAFAKAANVEHGNTTRFGENMGRRGFIRADKKVDRKTTKVWCGLALQRDDGSNE